MRTSAQNAEKEITGCGVFLDFARALNAPERRAREGRKQGARIGRADGVGIDRERRRSGRSSGPFRQKSDYFAYQLRAPSGRATARDGGGGGHR